MTNIAKIPYGNDFDLRFVVTTATYTESETVYVDVDLTQCSDITVNLYCEKHGIIIPLQWELEDGSDNTIIAHVLGNSLEVGSTYGCFITGKDENDKAFRWEADGENMFCIVEDTNAMDLETISDIDVKIGLVSPQGAQGAQGATGAQGTDGIGFRLSGNNQYIVDNHVHVTHDDAINFYEGTDIDVPATIRINDNIDGRDDNYMHMIRANNFLFNEYNGVTTYQQCNLKQIIHDIYGTINMKLVGPQGIQGNQGELGNQGHQGEMGHSINAVSCSQEYYDNLETKDPYTLYIITSLT